MDNVETATVLADLQDLPNRVLSGELPDDAVVDEEQGQHVGGGGVRVDAGEARVGEDGNVRAKRLHQALVEALDHAQLVHGEQPPVRGALGRVAALVDASSEPRA